MFRDRQTAVKATTISLGSREEVVSL